MTMWQRARSDGKHRRASGSARRRRHTQPGQACRCGGPALCGRAAVSISTSGSTHWAAQGCWGTRGGCWSRAATLAAAAAGHWHGAPGQQWAGTGGLRPAACCWAAAGRWGVGCWRQAAPRRQTIITGCWAWIRVRLAIRSARLTRSRCVRAGAGAGREGGCRFAVGALRPIRLSPPAQAVKFHPDKPEGDEEKFKRLGKVSVSPSTATLSDRRAL